MINDFTDIFTLSVTLGDVMSNLLVALLCGSIISLVYRYTYKGLNYSASFAVSIVMLAMITSIVIMVIGNNLARAFGMVGAMSIIRFRTAVKDAADIMFIFFALTIGLACGVKMYAIAIFGTLFISLIYIILHLSGFGLAKRQEFLLQVTLSTPDTDHGLIESTIRQHASRIKLVNTKLLGEPGFESLELSYHIYLSNRNVGSMLVSSVKKLPSVLHVNLFFDEN